MLSSFEIRQFRGFSHLRIDKLANVNLIVGRNNVGKTMLLEALRLYAVGGDPGAIVEILENREEVKPAGPDRTTLDIDSLFYQGAERIRQKECQLEMGPVDDPENTLQIRTTRLRLKGGNGTGSYELVPPQEEPYIISNSFPGLSFSMGPSGKTHITYHDIQHDWNYGPSVLPPSLPPFLTARGISNNEIAGWWDRVSLRPAEQRVKECLGIIAPDVEGLSFVASPVNPAERMAKIRISSLPEPGPLKSLGDGMLRMLQIALGLEYANLGPENPDPKPIIRGFEQQLKILLVDEIENGIHYTVQGELWKFIIRAAQSLGVQVFATSHSWDSILGLREAISDIPDASVMVIRLEKKSQYTKAVLFEGSELDVVACDSIEVR